jgi:hypothetical protein
MINLGLRFNIEATRCINVSFPKAGIGLETRLIATKADSARKSIILKLAEDVSGVNVIDTIEGKSVTSIKGASDLLSIIKDDQVITTPCLFVTNPSLVVTGNNVSSCGGTVKQTFTEVFGVIIAVDNEEDEYGVNAMDLHRNIRMMVIISLSGWSIPELFDNKLTPLLCVKGDGYGMDQNEIIYWQIDFKCTYHFSSDFNKGK